MVTQLMRPNGFFASKLGYSNATVDVLIDDAAGESNLTQRAGHYAQVQAAAFHDQPMIWHTQSLAFHVERDWVRMWTYSPLVTNH